MALLSPPNQNLHTKPLLPIINPTPRISPNFYVVHQRNQPSPFYSSIQFHTRLRSRRGSFPVVNGLRKDSDQSRTQGDGDEGIGVKAALSMLRFYKREISPLLPNSCRYVPTCSEYSMIAYKKYGVVKGSILTAWRLCRCNPLGGSGFDPPRWFDEKRIQEIQEIEEGDNEEDD